MGGTGSVFSDAATQSGSGEAESPPEHQGVRELTTLIHCPCVALALKTQHTTLIHFHQSLHDTRLCVTGRQLGK